MDSFRQKTISVVIATIVTYFSFQSLDLILSIYQVRTYFVVSWYVYAFHIFWLTFLFDLHLKTDGHFDRARGRFNGVRLFFEAFKSRVRHLYHWSYLKHYLNYLILPSVFYWSVIILMHLNPFFELFKDVLIIMATGALVVVYWFFNIAFSRNMELHRTGLKVLALVKILAAVFSYTTLMAVGWYYGINLIVLLPVVFIITSLLLYQMLFQHKLVNISVYPAIIMFSILLTLVFTVIYQGWNVNYYTAGLMVAVVYNTCWGVLHQYLEKTLTRKVLWEYIFMMVVLVSIILSTHDFQGRI
ncbi:MAG TPA: hypothetical protein VEC17_00420 [Candidatus Binatia bacterium]|nr:hypothetical protein [Candidatus Binatia bacterium]